MALPSPLLFVTSDIIAQVPLGRLGEPEDIVGAILLYLAADEARWVIGSTVTVDGGYLNASGRGSR